MTRNKKLLIVSTGLVSILTYWMWATRKIEINALETKIVQFRELPPLVADVFVNTKKYRELGLEGGLISIDSANLYRFEVSKTGPWTDYFVITRNDTRKFKVPYGKAFPFVIYNSELFIPDTRNISNADDAEQARYERYRFE